VVSFDSHLLRIWNNKTTFVQEPGWRLAVACNGQGATTGGMATVGLATWLDKVVARIGVQLLAMTVF
jgi:hypothetical protein